MFHLQQSSLRDAAITTIEKLGSEKIVEPTSQLMIHLLKLPEAPTLEVVNPNHTGDSLTGAILFNRPHPKNLETQHIAAQPSLKHAEAGGNSAVVTFLANKILRSGRS